MIAHPGQRKIFFFDCQRGGEDPHLIVLPNCPKWLNSRKFYSWRTLAKSVTHSTPTPNTFFSLSSHYAASRTRPPLPSGLLGVVYVSIALHLLGRPSASLESSLFLPETPHCCGVSTAPNSTARWRYWSASLASPVVERSAEARYLCRSMRCPFPVLPRSGLQTRIAIVYGR